MRQFLATGLLLVLVSCNSKAPVATSENLLASNDYEQLAGWVPDGAISYLTSDKAPSGQYSAQVNGSNEYAGGYTNLLGKLSTTRLAKLRVHTWVWLPNKEAKALLVVQINDPANGASLFYNAIDLVSATNNKFGQWAEVDKTMELPATITATSLLKTYMWRSQSSQPVYLDDFQLERAN